MGRRVRGGAPPRAWSPALELVLARDAFELPVGAERASNQRQKSGPELLRIRLAFAELFWCICRIGSQLRKPSFTELFWSQAGKRAGFVFFI